MYEYILDKSYNYGHTYVLLIVYSCINAQLPLIDSYMKFVVLATNVYSHVMYLYLYLNMYASTD